MQMRKIALREADEYGWEARVCDRYMQLTDGRGDIDVVDRDDYSLVRAVEEYIASCDYDGRYRSPYAVIEIPAHVDWVLIPAQDRSWLYPDMVAVRGKVWGFDGGDFTTQLDRRGR